MGVGRVPQDRVPDNGRNTGPLDQCVHLGALRLGLTPLVSLSIHLRHALFLQGQAWKT
jgi:hypothetical protein